MNSSTMNSDSSSSLAKYYDKVFSSSEGGNIYKPFNLWESLSHTRKMQLLEKLDLPDLTDAVVVDYGVGSWGFGCVFPRLKQCAKAIGIDISRTAIELSKGISKKDPALRHAKLHFDTSVGYEIPLKDESVDVFFAGECIEHIEETETFLIEVHRILKKDGVAIFTTPNRLPFVYRNLNLEWCMGYEHVGLMSSHELIKHFRTHFEVLSTKGFNQSLHPSIDAHVDEKSAQCWGRRVRK